MSAVVVERIEGVVDFEHAPRCEHSQHHYGTGAHLPHHDGDEQYVIIFAPCGCEEPTTVVLCGTYVTAAFSSTHVKLKCRVCGRVDEPQALYKVLGPVNP
jgi:hypothetical protein